EPIPDPLDQLTEEQRAMLKNYEEEFPEIAQAEALRQQVAMQRAFNAFSQELAKVLSPLFNQVTEVSQDRHVQQIAKAHPDYEQLTPKVVEWVSQQPAFVRDAYQRVLYEGATQEVIDLLNFYKQQAGATAPSAPQPDPKATAAAAAMAPVQSKRTTPAPTQPDPNDFASAFMEAVRSV
ncbi:MAG: hypothetical protein ACP5D5_08870, partial [Acidithiobacillus sp.]|uniref:hypothetical protein n=1 Tax=Acidithiobacillus sp. TaxID=1872118 RepID=UPI003CFD91CF